MGTIKLLDVWINRDLISRGFHHGAVAKRLTRYDAPRGYLVFGKGFATITEKRTIPSRKPGLKAADIAAKLRRETETETTYKVPVSPLQRRVAELRQFSQKLQSIHPNVFAKVLYKSILYQDRHLIAINKPYGVPVYSNRGIRNSITGSLPVLAKIIDGMQAGSQLHTCYSVEKDTTGVLLLARTEETAEHVRNLIKSHQMESKYMVVTVGVPVPSEGVIDIPIIEKEVAGSQHHYKMGLSPLYRVTEEGDGLKKVRAHRQAHSAVTQYRVLDSSSGCSLVELQPLTGVKHQLRVHMALGLACPLLGDHKYSHWNKLAPQTPIDGI
ncbi:mitochondrial RNA pseudouridine synthase rpusd4 isoform X2 [Electrophorus electricus]|uniref:mitochondrial RNA pseudouridine synthase rpusd4 isoform X2 n=1 Tax=Electrophorus electricus TaxID=8005 RepID=UPI0015CFF61D|nr:mitochondrial RNA pseudouridine synthase rpusd4 isoform X2 [Electrophorus electricus]